jgi:hypothetical protein
MLGGRVSHLQGWVRRFRRWVAGQSGASLHEFASNVALACGAGGHAAPPLLLVKDHSSVRVSLSGGHVYRQGMGDRTMTGLNQEDPWLESLSKLRSQSTSSRQIS